MRTRGLLVLTLFCSALAGCTTSAPPPLPLQTDTPSPTFTLPLNETETVTPTPTLLFPTMTIPRNLDGIHSHLPFEGVRISLDCQTDPIYTHCYDPVLEMDFEYPTAWGEITALLGSGGYEGYEYTYLIGNPSTGQWRLASGLSKDYSEGREANVHDFGIRDHSQWSAEDVCQRWVNAASCRQIRPNVLFAVSPDLQMFCEKYVFFYWLWPPFGSVIVQLPDNDTINGFIFVTWPLSNSVQDRIGELIGLDGSAVPHNCTAETNQAYTVLMQEVALGQPTDFVDAETARNIQDLLHLAESIEFR